MGSEMCIRDRYNIGCGVNYSINQIANMISDNQVSLPERPGESRVTKANTEKMRKTFGWKPQIDLQDWIIANVF